MSITGRALEYFLEARKVYRIEMESLTYLNSGELAIKVSREGKKEVLSLPDGIKSIVPPKAKVLSVDFVRITNYVDRGGGVGSVEKIVIHYIIPDPPEIRLPKREADRETIGEEAGP